MEAEIATTVTEAGNAMAVAAEIAGIVLKGTMVVLVVGALLAAVKTSVGVIVGLATRRTSTSRHSLPSSSDTSSSVES